MRSLFVILSDHTETQKSPQFPSLVSKSYAEKKKHDREKLKNIHKALNERLNTNRDDIDIAKQKGNFAFLYYTIN